MQNLLPATHLKPVLHVVVTIVVHPGRGGGGGGQVLRIFVCRGVRMEGKIQTEKHGFPENFAPKDIRILHISYPKMWVKILF